MTTLVHVMAADLSVRSDGRTVEGMCVPFDTPTPVADQAGAYTECFDRGSFRQITRDPGRVRMVYEHTDDLLGWVGRAVLLREDTEGLFGEFRVDDTDRGRALRYKISDGQLTGLSVGFVPGRSYTDLGGVVHRKVVDRLDHVAVVESPAYPGARVLAVRTASGPTRRLGREEWESRFAALRR